MSQVVSSSPPAAAVRGAGASSPDGATPAPSPATAGGGRSEDRRWNQVNVRIRRLGARPDGLIEVLHTVQEVFGYLDDDALAYVSDALGVPPSQVMGVATFYSHFSLKPQGAHTCVVCTGTACYINGAMALLERVGQRFGIKVGQTSPQGDLSLLAARCVGACSMAPAVVVDGDVHGQVTPSGIDAILDESLLEPAEEEPS
ncbi:MAG TPA: NAD(P)H-dependent oxidoreductase subunit E [Acidimicrobiales bacterium]|nr:NAD(P)H-dependent oxidoreductase subunit E [Acidimicrobiales bacterium]